MIATKAAAFVGLCVLATGCGAASTGDQDHVAITTTTTAEESDRMGTSGPAGDSDIIEIHDLPPLGAPGVASADTEAVGRYGAANEASFAGALLAGGRLWVGFTADHERHLAEARVLVTAPEQVGVFRAQFPMVELRRLQDRISQDTTALRDAGIRVSLVAVDVTKNRVTVGVENAADPAVVEALHRRYPREQLVVESGVVIRPVAGGAADR